MKTEIKDILEIYKLIKDNDSDALLEYIDYLHSKIGQFDCTCTAIISQLGTNYDEIRKSNYDIL